MDNKGLKMTQREKLVGIIEDVIDANKVDEVMTIDIKTVSDIKEFFNQHLERVRSELRKAIQSLEDENEPK